VSERGYYCVILAAVLFGQSVNCTHLTVLYAQVLIVLWFLVYYLALTGSESIFRKANFNDNANKIIKQLLLSLRKYISEVGKSLDNV